MRPKRYTRTILIHSKSAFDTIVRLSSVNGYRNFDYSMCVVAMNISISGKKHALGEVIGTINPVLLVVYDNILDQIEI